MKTVGELLKEARLRKNIRRVQVARKTKISLAYIKAIERNEFEKLPEAAFVKGFIRNYANAVNLNPDQALAIFRRDYDQNLKGQVIPRELNRTDIRTSSLWTPRTTFAIAIASLIIIFGVYFLYQYQLLAAAPTIEILEPQEEERIHPALTVAGRTDPQAKVAINNQYVEVREDGSFEQSLVLPVGTRTITIEATSRAGKTRTIQRTVRVE